MSCRSYQAPKRTPDWALEQTAMRFSECPPLHRELREDREEDRGRLNVLLPAPHHQHPEPHAPHGDSGNVGVGATNELRVISTNGELTAFELRVVSLGASLAFLAQLPHSFDVGRLDARYWFPGEHPKLSFHLVHREESPKLAGKHTATGAKRGSYEGNTRVFPHGDTGSASVL